MGRQGGMAKRCRRAQRRPARWTAPWARRCLSLIHSLTVLDAVVNLADYIEPTRSYPDVDEIRRLAQGSLFDTLCEALGRTMIPVSYTHLHMPYWSKSALNFSGQPPGHSSTALRAAA